MSSSSDSDVSAKFFTPDKVGVFSRLSEMSSEELAMRFFATVGSCAGLIAFQRGIYNIAAFLCVAISLNSQDDWPPFNGPYHETYNLRYFWSTFWHQNNTHRLSSMSRFMMHDVLRLRRGTILVQYLRICLMFLFSGLQHVAIDFASGIPPWHSGAMQFFLMQPLGLVIENLIVSLWNKGSQAPAKSPVKWWQCLLGWIWAGSWMAWTAPTYIYPIMALDSSESGGVVPLQAHERQGRWQDEFFSRLDGQMP
ncbi:triacylglycerol lipase-like protein [Apiospora arundinis]